MRTVDTKGRAVRRAAEDQRYQEQRLCGKHADIVATRKGARKHAAMVAG